MTKLNLNLLENYYEARAKAIKHCTEFIKLFIEDHNNSISFYNIDKQEYVGDEQVTVTYDGGNHSEYASNAFSTIENAFVKDGKIYLGIEDCEEYEIDRCQVEEILYIAQYLNDNKPEFDHLANVNEVLKHAKLLQV